MTFVDLAYSRRQKPRSLGLAATVAFAIAIVSPGIAAGQDEAATESAAPTSSAAPTTIDGTWTLDTSIGIFDDFTSSWVGFRVAEVLERIGETEAVGRTPVVSGSLEVAGTTIENATIEADLTAIKSDQARRDPAIQRALQTAEFPTATFQSSKPVDLGAVPASGETFMASVPGQLTVHGVSEDVVLELTAQRVDDIVVVVGVLPIDFTAFGVTMPTAPVVVSVEDNGSLEWQLYFSYDA